MIRQNLTGLFGWMCETPDCGAGAMVEDGGAADRISRRDAATHVQDNPGHSVITGRGLQRLIGGAASEDA